MQNGNGMNGAAAMVPHTVTVNPMQAAAFALQFLARAPTTRAEREAYDMAEMFLQAIASGQVSITPVVQPGAPAAAAPDGTAPQ